MIKTLNENELIKKEKWRRDALKELEEKRLEINEEHKKMIELVDEAIKRGDKFSEFIMSHKCMLRFSIVYL